MGITPLQGFTIPDLSGAPNGPSNFSTFGAFVEKYVVMRFTTTAARDAAVTVPEEGMVAYCTTPDRMYMYSGSAWVLIGWTTTAGRPGVILTDAAQSITSASITDITWGTEVSDVDGWTSGASATLTVPTGLSGWYSISYSGVWSAGPGTTQGVQCLINGSSAYACNGSSLWNPTTLSFTRALSAADTLKFQVYQSSGGAINVVSRCEIVWLGV